MFEPWSLPSFGWLFPLIFACMIRWSKSYNVYEQIIFAIVHHVFKVLSGEYCTEYVRWTLDSQCLFQLYLMTNLFTTAQRFFITNACSDVKEKSKYSGNIKKQITTYNFCFLTLIVFERNTWKLFICNCISNFKRTNQPR